MLISQPDSENVMRSSILSTVKCAILWR